MAFAAFVCYIDIGDRTILWKTGGICMYVCVYDGKNQRHYRSMVYGLMNTGYYERAIVMNPLEENFVLVSYQWDITVCGCFRAYRLFPVGCL